MLSHMVRPPHFHFTCNIRVNHQDHKHHHSPPHSKKKKSRAQTAGQTCCPVQQLSDGPLQGAVRGHVQTLRPHQRRDEEDELLCAGGLSQTGMKLKGFCHVHHSRSSIPAKLPHCHFLQGCHAAGKEHRRTQRQVEVLHAEVLRHHQNHGLHAQRAVHRHPRIRILCRRAFIKRQMHQRAHAVSRIKAFQTSFIPVALQRGLSAGRGLDVHGADPAVQADVPDRVGR